MACAAARLLPPGFRLIVAWDGGCGLRRTLGAPKPGKLADYELTGPDCSRCHVVLLRGGLSEVHADRVSPRCSPLGHLLVDAWKLVVWVHGAVGVAGVAAGSAWLWLTGVAGLALTLIGRLLFLLATR